MKFTVRSLLIAGLALVFTFATGMMLWQHINSRNAQQANAYAQELVHIPSDPVPAAEVPVSKEDAPTEDPENTEPIPDRYAQLLLQTELSALQQINSEITGWIQIPNTDINYPLLHTTDNSTYLHTAWDGTYSQAGSIFLETRANPNLEDFNTIIYGHNMRNGSMFAPLSAYKDEQFRVNHPDIYIVTKQGVYKYTVFAAYEAAVVSDTYRLLFRDDAQKQTAIDSYVTRSDWDCPVVPTVSDRILTLSTCTGTGQYETRWVVQGVLSGFWAKEDAGLLIKTGIME